MFPTGGGPLLVAYAGVRCVSARIAGAYKACNTFISIGAAVLPA